MQITRTSNAGVLITISDTKILLDGINRPMYPYEGTPVDIKSMLCKTPPDVVLFTHRHDDHFDSEYVEFYQKITSKKIFEGRKDAFLVSGFVTVKSVASRHIGKTDIDHFSYVISAEGKKILFTGDASPSFLKVFENERFDVIIAPYAYALTESAFKKTSEITSELVIVHLPLSQNDELGLIKQVGSIVKDSPFVHIPMIGESIIF